MVTGPIVVAANLVLLEYEPLNDFVIIQLVFSGIVFFF